MVVYANIGSNLGDRESLISKALDKIGEKFGFYCISEFVESEPWGFDSTNFFMNIGVAFKSNFHPEEILLILQGIEKSLTEVEHRDSHGNYKDRELDIDIMAIDEIVYNSPKLKIPHPHLLDREFFLIPLFQLNPEWKYPKPE